jgi:hypothetical protein
MRNRELPLAYFPKIDYCDNSAKPWSVVERNCGQKEKYLVCFSFHWNPLASLPFTLFEMRKRKATQEVWGLGWASQLDLGRTTSHTISLRQGHFMTMMDQDEQDSYLIISMIFVQTRI